MWLLPLASAGFTPLACWCCAAAARPRLPPVSCGGAAPVAACQLVPPPPDAVVPLPFFHGRSIAGGGPASASSSPSPRGSSFLDRFAAATCCRRPCDSPPGSTAGAGAIGLHPRLLAQRLRPVAPGWQRQLGSAGRHHGLRPLGLGRLQLLIVVAQGRAELLGQRVPLLQVPLLVGREAVLVELPVDGSRS